MKRQQCILAGLTLALMGATAAVLLHLRAHQRMGEPGVKTRPLAGSQNLEILMPEATPGYTSVILTNVEAGLSVLPADTSYRSRGYREPDGFSMQITTVLMGTDRSSIHNPQICLPGQGWAIDDAQTRVASIPMERPVPYDLPVNKLVSAKAVKDADGNDQTVSSVYLYWYVDGDQFTASAWKWKVWFMPRDLLTTGVMDRWAYITCFSSCAPGQEETTYERMKKMIAQVVPEFQMVPRAHGQP